MATTGIFLRRANKADLILDPPLVGEIVFALDTQEYGALISGQIIWRDVFHGPGVMVVGTIEERGFLTPLQNDFCYVTGIKSQFIYLNDTWVPVGIDDLNSSESSTWSSAKILFELQNLQMDLGSY